MEGTYGKFGMAAIEQMFELILRQAEQSVLDNPVWKIRPADTIETAKATLLGLREMRVKTLNPSGTLDPWETRWVKVWQALGGHYDHALKSARLHAPPPDPQPIVLNGWSFIRLFAESGTSIAVLKNEAATLDLAIRPPGREWPKDHEPPANAPGNDHYIVEKVGNEPT